MIESLARTLTEIPMLTLFVVIGLGYLLGEIEFRGFRLGVAYASVYPAATIAKIVLAQLLL